MRRLLGLCYRLQHLQIRALISEALHLRLAHREAVHKGCGGTVKALFYMLVCERCHSTLDEKTDILVEWKSG